MRHLLLILVLLIASYGLWQAARPKQRRIAAKALRRHALRLLAVVLLLFLLFFAAVQHPSIQIF